MSRGSITVLISCDREETVSKLTWDKESVKSYISIFNEIKESFSIQEPLTLTQLLNFSDFIKTEAAEFNEDMLWEHIVPVVQKALKEFQKARDTEGAYMVADMTKILDEISSALAIIEKRAPERIEQYAAALKEKVEKLIASPPDPMRMATEIALMADRLDISEECTRLRAHIEKFRQDFSADEPVGKRIGFLLQEMNREANTIGSKANDTEISHLSVKLKEYIEKIRELIQNIE
ncbi:MAG TPA: YicC/YloC family endoribonuclease [Chitinispirillaceae bacterium]|nr:YicC/YloC family endoribonuclease [Chitinispirillaceae bacterium]